MFRRKIYDRMLEWKRDAHGRYALLIEGAPCVGKTSIAEEFARNEYRSYVIIDLSCTKRNTKKALKNFDGDVDSLFSSIQVSESVNLHMHESLVIFDNIQDDPQTRQMISLLIMDGRYDYIEIGTLVSLERHVRDISIPSEEVGLSMYPMDFEEFMWALGDEISFDVAREAFERREPVEHAIHAKLMNRFREYLLVGGMPASVETFVKDHDPNVCEIVKKEIISKFHTLSERYPYCGGKASKKIITNIPKMLSKGNGQFSPNMVREDSKTRDYINSMIWLRISSCSLIASNWDRLRLMIPPFINEMSFKCYMCDCGLLSTMTGDVTESLLLGDMCACNGKIYENSVAQALVSSGHRLVFYDNEDGRADFMTVDGSRPGFVICKPLVSSKHIAFDRFLAKHRNIGECFVVHSGNISEDNNLIYVPVYLSILI